MNLEKAIKILESGLTTQQEQLEIASMLKSTNIKNKDILFSHWYDSLEGTKSQGFAYKAWSAGWNAANQARLVKCNCISPERCDLYDRCLKHERT